MKYQRFSAIEIVAYTEIESDTVCTQIFDKQMLVHQKWATFESSEWKR
jgi:hypothetical protein